MEVWVVKSGDEYIHGVDFDEDQHTINVLMTGYSDDAREYDNRAAAYGAAYDLSCSGTGHDDPVVLKRRIK